jgi:hypothetical protein
MIFQPKDKDKALIYINKLIDLNHNFEIITKYKNRSLQQNKYLHLILTWFCIESGYSLDYVKQELFKKEVNKDIFYIDLVNPKTDALYYEYRSTSKLDAKEMTDAIQRFRIYASREAGIYLPDANEFDFLTHIQNEIERYKEYL